MTLYALFYRYYYRTVEDDEEVPMYDVLEGVFSSRENVQRYIDTRPAPSNDDTENTYSCVDCKWLVVEVQLDSYGFTMP